ncbi:hypothetical protein [Buttiauxella izardii]|uniref:EcsC family protein n=1 Tax=Buttiauxella izardii TaxID=82991 RepID=A0A3A5JL56_9ENTR|nr:hypothetical protein [Buttiauxella izardii]RJT19515.1 hypothetical protein D6029_18555 [Buttiauxella izardii]
MSENSNDFSLPTLLNWIYQQAIEGAAGFDSAEQLARQYLNDYPSPETAVDKLICHESLKNASCSFITGLGGPALLPLSLPVNVSGSWYFQLRMSAAIAIIGGHSVNAPEIQLLAGICLAGDVAISLLCEQLLRQLVARQLAPVAAAALTGSLTSRLCALLSRLLLTSGSGLWIPLIGGLTSGSRGYLTARATGALARQIFICDDFRLFQS